MFKTKLPHLQKLWIHIPVGHLLISLWLIIPQWRVFCRPLQMTGACPNRPSSAPVIYPLLINRLLLFVCAIWALSGKTSSCGMNHTKSPNINWVSISRVFNVHFKLKSTPKFIAFLNKMRIWFIAALLVLAATPVCSDWWDDFVGELRKLSFKFLCF